MKLSVLHSKLGRLVLVSVMAASFTVVKAQMPMTAMNSAYTTATSGNTYSALGAPGSTLSGTTYTYNYGSASGTTSNILNILSFMSGPNTYAYRNQPGAMVKIRRNNNAVVTGMRQLLWYEATSVPPSTTVNLSQPYQSNMEIMFNGAKGLNAGTDNIFCNTGDVNGNNNDIERFDYIIPSGNVIGVATEEGFTVMDRGVLSGHDPFCVAVITSLDGSNNPSGYTNVLRLSATDYGTVNPIPSITTGVLRLDGAESTLKISTSTPSTQGIGGVFIRYSDLGLTAGTTVYGYSLLGNDFPIGASPSNLVDWTNTTYFPTGTTADDGGLDMIAVSGVFKLSGSLAPAAYDYTASSFCNSTGSGASAIAALTAVDFNPGGSIVSYTIYTLPSALAGVLYYFNGTAHVALTAGQTLTPAEAATLTFDAVDGYTGNASFTYYATNAASLLSNTATYTIPVAPVPGSGFSINTNPQSLTGNSFVFTSTPPTTGNSYAWSYGDGGSSASVSPNHSYTAAGIYTVTQIVSSPSSGCSGVFSATATVLSDSVSGGGGGGLESESLGGLVSIRDFHYIKNSISRQVNYQNMQPIQAANVAAKGTGSSAAGELKRFIPASLDANTTAYETSPADIVEITKAVDVYSVDYVNNNHAKAVVLGILTLGKVYTHTKSICDRLRGATLLNTSVKNIQGYNFIEYALLRENGVVEYCIAFDAGKSAGRNTFSMQTNWLIADYTGDDSVFNFQVWAADPANTEALAGRILANLNASMPVQQTDTAFKLPTAYIANGTRNKGSLDLTITNNTDIVDAEIVFDERVTETANVDELSVPITLKAGTDNKISIPIKDGYEYPGSLYLNGQLVDVVYMADGNWSLDYDQTNTNITKYAPENEPDRIYPDNEYPVYRSLVVKGSSSDYFSAYKFVASGNAVTDLSQYHTFKFFAKGSGKATVTLAKNSIVNWKDQYQTVITLDTAGKNYELSFSDFTAASSTIPFTANDITTAVFTCSFNTVPTDFSFNLRELSFSPEQVIGYNQLHSKNMVISPNPNTGSFDCNFFSDVDQTLDLYVSDITGRQIYKQSIAAKTGSNSIPVTLPADVARPGMVILSIGNKQNQYSKVKMTTME